MAELMRKFFEMNDLDVIIVAALYFTIVIGLWIYTWKKWGKEDEEKSKTKNDTHGCRTVKTAKDVTDRKGSKVIRGSKKARGKDWG